MFPVDDTVCTGHEDERETHLFRVRKLDMEMTTETLETGGVNGLFVSVTVDESFTTEQTIP